MTRHDITLLYVEDDIETANAMTLILQEYFKNILVANTATDALNLYKDNSVDMLLCDIELPDFNGLELIEKLKNIDENLIIIISSACDDKKYLLDAIKLSVCDYLVKPFHLEQFDEMVQKCMKKLSKKKIQHLAYYDQLTNAYNRHKLTEVFIALQQQNKPFGCIIIDIDDFKQINDRYGHLTGDETLKKLTTCFQNNIRERDIFGRWGGEEFVLFLPDIDRVQLAKKANKLREIISRCDFDKVGHVSVSMGAGLYGEEENFEALMSKIDSALYMAKQNGKNRVELI